MYLEVKQFPESQKVMDDPNWFFITDGLDDSELGHSAYARIIDKELEEIKAEVVKLARAIDELNESF